jgi:hypothetical protein
MPVAYISESEVANRGKRFWYIYISIYGLIFFNY